MRRRIASFQPVFPFLTFSLIKLAGMAKFSYENPDENPLNQVRPQGEKMDESDLRRELKHGEREGW